MLETLHLTKSYNGSKALEDLNLPHSFLRDLLPSGRQRRGKTTTINLFLNFIPPTSGTARR